MAKLVVALIFSCLIVSQAASALTFTETRSQTIEQLKKSGIGSVWFYKFHDGRGTILIQVLGLAPNPGGQGMMVTGRFVDDAGKVKIVHGDKPHSPGSRPGSPESRTDDRSHDRHSGEQSQIQKPNSDVTTPRKLQGLDFSSLGKDLSVGIESGAMAGLQVALIEGSGLNDQINNSNARIEAIYQQIQRDLAAIEEININLRNQAIVIIENDGASSPHLLPNLDLAGISKERIRQIVASKSNRGGPINWISDDSGFLKRGRAIESSLASARIKDSIDQTYHDISRQALIDADQASFLGQDEEAEFLLEVAKIGASVLLGLNPFVGSAVDLYECISGTNLVTGEALSAFDRTVSFFGVLSGGYGSKAFKALKATGKLASKLAPKTKKIWDASHRLGEWAIRQGVRTKDQLRKQAAVAKRILGNEVGAVGAVGKRLNIEGMATRFVAKSAEDLRLLKRNLTSASDDRIRHILYGDRRGGGHLFPGKPGKNVFPSSWDGDKIINEAMDIINDPNTVWTKRNGVWGERQVERYNAIGVRDGVKISVTFEPLGEGLITASPKEGLGVIFNPK